MQFYIVNDKKTAIFNSVPELVRELEVLVKQKIGMSRKEYMQNLIDLGYGYDDPQGVTFTQAMTEFFEIGTFNNGQFKKTNVHESEYFSKYKKEFGD